MILSKESKQKNYDSLIQKSNVQSKKIKEYDEGGYKSNKAKKYKDNYQPTYYNQPEYYQPNYQSNYYQNESQYYNQTHEHTNYVNKLPNNDYINNNTEFLKSQPAPQVAIDYYSKGDLFMFDAFH